jgi:plasmid stabilization system protein ParE
MTPRLTLRPIARAEIEEAYGWYEERLAGLGEEFLAAVRDALTAVEEAPRRHPVIRNGVRRALVRRFPYSILYMAEPGATVVLACFHGSRDPRRWHDRR